MLRLAAAVAAVVLAVSPATACTFCGGDVRSRQTLRMHFAAAKAVLYGQLKNPRVDPKTDAGSTEFHATAAFKDDPARGGKTMLVIPQYLPVIGNTPSELPALLRRRRRQARPDASASLPHPRLWSISRVPRSWTIRIPPRSSASTSSTSIRPTPRLPRDAFFEFARASDAEILKAAKQIDRREGPHALGRSRRRRPSGSASSRSCWASPAARRTRRSWPGCSTKTH